MNPVIKLTPDPSKTLDDYPDIKKNYRTIDYKWLAPDLAEYKSRAEKPLSPWDVTFAHIHVLALEREIAWRKANKFDIGTGDTVFLAYWHEDFTPEYRPYLRQWGIVEEVFVDTSHALVHFADTKLLITLPALRHTDPFA